LNTIVNKPTYTAMTILTLRQSLNKMASIVKVLFSLYQDYCTAFRSYRFTTKRHNYYMKQQILQHKMTKTFIIEIFSATCSNEL